jgi:hypothetical protein
MKGFLNDPGVAFANCRRPNFYRENFRRPAASNRRVFCACERLRSKSIETLTHPENRPC